MKVWLIFLIPFFLVSCTSNEKKNKDMAHYHFKLGVSLSSKGQISRSLDQFLKANKLDPNNPLILNHLGMAYYFLKEYEHSILTFKSALKKNPDYSEVHNNLGRVYVEINDFKQARYYLLKAATDLTYSHKDKVWLNMGLSYFFEGNYRESAFYFSKAFEQNNMNCLAYNYYGRSQMELKKFKQAVQSFNKALSCGKKYSYEPYYYGALSLFRLGYRSKALSFLSKSRKHFSGVELVKIDEIIKKMEVLNQE